MTIDLVVDNDGQDTILRNITRYFPLQGSWAKNMVSKINEAIDMYPARKTDILMLSMYSAEKGRCQEYIPKLLKLNSPDKQTLETFFTRSYEDLGKQPVKGLIEEKIAAK